MAPSLPHPSAPSDDEEPISGEEDSQDEEEEEEKPDADEDSEQGERGDEENAMLRDMDTFSDCSGALNLDEAIQMEGVFDVESEYGDGGEPIDSFASFASFLPLPLRRASSPGTDLPSSFSYAFIDSEEHEAFRIEDAASPQKDRLCQCYRLPFRGRARGIVPGA